MERRLLKAIINPAMIVTWLAGLYLVWVGHWLSAGWFHIKFLLVLIMSGVHGFLARWVKDFASHKPQRQEAAGRSPIRNAPCLWLAAFSPVAALRVITSARIIAGETRHAMTQRR